MREIFYAILSRICFGKTALHLKSLILRQLRGTDAQEYLCVFQAAVTMQMTKIRLYQAYVFLCGGSFRKRRAFVILSLK